MDDPCHWRDRNVLEETETKCVCWIFLPSSLYVLSQECLIVRTFLKGWCDTQIPINCHIFLLNKVINCHNCYLYGKKYLTCFFSKKKVFNLFCGVYSFFFLKVRLNVTQNLATWEEKSMVILKVFIIENFYLHDLDWLWILRFFAVKR